MRMFVSMLAAGLVVLFSTPVLAVTAAEWVDPGSGSIGSVGFTASGLGSPFLGIETLDMDSTDFAAGPLTGVEVVAYGADDDWTVKFSAPVTGLLLYVASWRGSFNGAFDDPPVHYAFDAPFEIASGLEDALVVGNVMTLDDDGGQFGFHDGILRFPGTLTSLSVDSEGALNASGQWMTYGLVPEPALLLGAMAIAAALLRRRR